MGARAHGRLRGIAQRYSILLWLVLVAGSGLWPIAVLAQSVLAQSAVAQSPEQGDDSVRVGDRWVYDSKDEITGLPRSTYSEVVTEVSAKEIVVSTTWRGTPGSALFVYDHDWNKIEQPNAKFKPHNGQGISLPLAVGKEWRAEFQWQFTQKDSSVVAYKSSSLSKVVGQETITTSAGTFDTFKIENRIQSINAADPSQLTLTETVGWYAPQINHWVRRKFLTKVRNRTQSSTSEELNDFSRKF
jgi:hypothetical protein